jgi:hypothetical protein
LTRRAAVRRVGPVVLAVLVVDVVGVDVDVGGGGDGGL